MDVDALHHVCDVGLGEGADVDGDVLDHLLVFQLEMLETAFYDCVRFLVLLQQFVEGLR
jgi:hypothetical protein